MAISDGTSNTAAPAEAAQADLIFNNPGQVITGTPGGDNLSDLATGGLDFGSDDVVNGLGGDDFIWVHNGNDTVNAGDGNDHIFDIGFGNDLLRGEAGSD